jgi:hypothetical protein
MTFNGQCDRSIVGSGDIIRTDLTTDRWHHLLEHDCFRLTRRQLFTVMARLVRATWRGTVLVLVARTSRAVTEIANVPRNVCASISNNHALNVMARLDRAICKCVMALSDGPVRPAPAKAGAGP